MSRLELITVIPAPIERCFDLSRDIDAHRGSMAASGEEAVGGTTTGLIDLGGEVTWRARHFGLVWQMTSRITEMRRPTWFVDEMRHGPFRSFRHEHHFERRGEATVMQDVVHYQLPLGLPGVLVDAVGIRWYLRHLLTVRNNYLADQATTAAP